MKKRIWLYFWVLLALTLRLEAQVVDVPRYPSNQTILSPFKNAVAKVVEDNSVFYMDTLGRKFELLPTEYLVPGNQQAIFDFENEQEKNPDLLPNTVIRYQTERGIGILSPKAEILLEATYDDVEIQNRHFWKLRKDGHISYRLPDGTILPFFEDMGYIDGEYFDVKQGGKWHLYSKTEQRITTTLGYDGFDYCGGCGMHSSYLYAQLEGQWGIIDWKENVLVPFQYQHVHQQMRSDQWVASFSKDNHAVIVHIPTQKEFFHGELAGSLLIAKENNKYGVYNAEANLVVPFEYELIEATNRYAQSGSYSIYFVSTRDRKKGLLNAHGDVILSNEYDDIQVYYDYFIAKKGTTCLLFNSKQEKLLSVEHMEISPIQDYSYSSESADLPIFKVKHRAYYGLYFAETGTYIDPIFYQVSISYPNASDSEAYRTVQGDKNGLISLFSLRGDLLLDRVEKISYSYLLPKQLVSFEKKDKTGLFDLSTQREIIPPQYTRIQQLQIGQEQVLQASLYTHEGEGEQHYTHLYAMNGEKVLDMDIDRIDSVTAGILLIKTHAGGYILWNR